LIQLEGQRVCELGAGTGFCGIVAMKLNAEVVLTDLPVWLPLIQQNIDQNASITDSSLRSSKCAVLQWGSDHDLKELPLSPPFSLILCSDLVYEQIHYDALIQTLLDATNTSSIILMSYEKRKNREREFWLLLSVSFEWKIISDSYLPEEYRCSEIGVFWIERKQQKEEMRGLSMNELLAQSFFSIYPHDDKYLTREEEAAIIKL